MKKAVLILAVLLIAASLCACGGSSAANAPEVFCANGHSWINATCDAAQTCSVCGVVVGEPKHHWQGAVCDTPAVCTVCGVTAGKALEHDYTDWIVNQQESLFRYCRLCGGEDVCSLAELADSTDFMGQVLPLLAEFRTGTWTAKLIMGENLNQCRIPEEEHRIVFSPDAGNPWPELSFKTTSLHLLR